MIKNELEGRKHHALGITPDVIFYHIAFIFILSMEAVWSSETLVIIPHRFTASQPKRPRLKSTGTACFGPRFQPGTSHIR
jgi:hypothetical protein